MAVATGPVWFQLYSGVTSRLKSVAILRPGAAQVILNGHEYVACQNYETIRTAMQSVFQELGLAA